MDPAQAAFLPVCAQAGEPDGAGVGQGAAQCSSGSRAAHALCVQGTCVDVGEAPSAEILLWFSLRNMSFVIAELV